MKAEEKFGILLSGLKPKHWYELIYIIIFAVLFIATQFGFVLNIPGEYHGAVAVFIFGALHIVASNILAFMYNLNWVIFPWAFKVNATFLKILGAIICSWVLIKQIV
ncbi:MAG: hypothetical protein AB1724_13065 [Thermodesulfobacteriota bacterium]